MEELHSCSCCLVRPPEKGLKTLYKHLGKTEIYYDMLRDCFDINLGMGNEECGICELCVGRLRDACDFKLQVQRSQAELQARLNGVITASNKLKIKFEKAPETETLIRDIKVEKSEVEMADGEIVSVSVAIQDGPPACSAEPIATTSNPSSSAPDPTLGSKCAPSSSHPKILACDVCQRTFDRPNAKYHLLIHRRTHTGEKPYACNVCNKRFIQKYHLNTHYALHMGKFNFSCEVCNKRFLHKHLWIAHMRTHTGERPFVCNICNKNYRYRSHLTLHRKKSHSESIPVDKKHDCDICGKRFSLLGNYLKHKQLHEEKEKEGPEDPKPYECDVCHKRFALVGILNSHKEIHNEETPFECEECHKKFRRKRYLEMHVKVHGNTKQYACEVCGQQFTHQSSFKRHIKIHTGEKRFSCEICHKRFGRSTILRDHMLIHSGLKLYSCKVCSKEFRQKNALDVHVRRLHTDERPYPCDVCKKGFAALSALKFHYRTHTGEKPYVCEICQMKFARADGHRKHLIRVHKVKPSK